jgi:hypothetical protein
MPTTDSFERFLPEEVPFRGSLCVFPPAVGLEPGFALEAARYARLGISVLVWKAPYLRPLPPRGLQHPEAEEPFWNGLRQAFARDLDEEPSWKKEAPVGFLGFNLGGSAAAHVAQSFGASFVVVAGSVPRLSDFWIRSGHEAALRARAKGPFEEDAFASAARPFDLTTSLASLSAPAFVQFGSRDPWIEPEQANELEALGRARVRWYDAEHGMLESDAADDRLDYIHTALSLKP